MSDHSDDRLLSAKLLLLKEHEKWLSTQGAEGSRLDFSGCDLRSANFDKSNLSAASFRGADFYSAILSGASFANAELRDSVFRWTDLVKADVNRIRDKS